jgi:uridine kinase
MALGNAEHRRESTGSGSSLNDDRKRPFLIGVAGGTASGKSTVCDKIRKMVVSDGNLETERQIITLSQDSFYRNLNEKESEQAKQGMFNFDHPDAFDHDLMLKCLQDIREGKSTQVPVYDFKSNARIEGKFDTIRPSDVVLLEGILVFYLKDVREMFDMKLFVDTDADTRLARRVLRDTEHRGRDLEHVLFQYTHLVKPAFEEFCLPTKKHADVIIPRGADNSGKLYFSTASVVEAIPKQWISYIYLLYDLVGLVAHHLVLFSVAIDLVSKHIQDIIVRRKTSSKTSSPFTRSRSNSDSMIR